jgi:hypothetical protein
MCYYPRKDLLLWCAYRFAEAVYVLLLGVSRWCLQPWAWPCLASMCVLALAVHSQECHIHKNATFTRKACNMACFVALPYSFLILQLCLVILQLVATSATPTSPITNMTYHYFNCPTTNANATHVPVHRSLPHLLHQHSGAERCGELVHWQGEASEAHAPRKACLLIAGITCHAWMQALQDG